MPTWAVAVVVWGVSIPVALPWAYRRGFLATSEPIIVFRVPIVCFVAPALVLAALVELLLGLVWRSRA